MKTRILPPALACSLSLALGAITSACEHGNRDIDPRSVPHGTTGGESTTNNTTNDMGNDTGDDTGNGSGCTLTLGYWKNHNKYAANPSQDKPWPIPDGEDTVLCDHTWLEILQTPPPLGDAWYVLAHQWIAASLNVASGADAPANIDAAIAQAGSFLADCTISDAEHDDALATSDLLDSFNNGHEGVPHCADDPCASNESECNTSRRR